MAKVLLTGVMGPHGNILFDIAGDRLTRDQDIFTQTNHSHFQALHFIAQNMEAPCTVLEHPLPDELVEELKKGYDYVGINFTMVNIARTFEMCELIKNTAPNIKIVLGGYGTACFNTIFQSDEEILKYADYICHGEGVSFFRQLLGESLDEPIKQMVGPTGGSGFAWLDPYPEGGDLSCIISGLGCPNMCEFCSTSHYYGGEFIEMATANHMFEGMKQCWRSHTGAIGEIAIFDENLYKDKEKVARLGKLIREDEEFGLSRMAYFSFGSIEDLSKYDVVQDLAMNGVGTIWIGVESMYSDLDKRQGRDSKEVFDELHAHGINTVGSWIGGWDFHTKENIGPDLDYFISCKPTQSQLLPLTPIPGTTLFERLKAEGRLDEASVAKGYFGRTAGVHEWRKSFTNEEIGRIVESAHNRLYQENGPTIMRRLKVNLNGYKFCIKSKHKALMNHRAKYHKRMCANAFPFIKSCEFFAPNEKVRKEIAQIRKEYVDEFGDPGNVTDVKSDYIFLKASLSKITSVIGKRSPAEEPFRRYTYDRKPRRETEMPYDVEYPNKDKEYELVKRRIRNENALLDKVAELLETGVSSEEDSELSSASRMVLENIEAIGHLAKLVDKLGDRIGLAKGWLKGEVLKSIQE
jgi:haloalkane dehalogenase